jgi:hypothetical protein
VLTVGENPAVEKSVLLPGTLPPHAWRISYGENESAGMLAVDSDGRRLVQLDLSGQAVTGGTMSSVSEVDWLDRLKLRFGASGALIPATELSPRGPGEETRGQSAPAGGPGSSEPVLKPTDQAPEGPPPAPEADPR